MKKLNANAYCVILTTNMIDNKIYVLSTKENSIEFPRLELHSDNIDNLEDVVADHVKKFLVVNQLELTPQIISGNSAYITPKKKNTLDIVYGFLAQEESGVLDSHWINFDYKNPNTPYASLIFEVIRKLK